MDQAGASRQGLVPNLVVAKSGVQAQVARTCCTSEQREGGHLLTGERFHRVQERRPHAPTLLVRGDSQSTDVPDAPLVACPDGPDDASGSDGFEASLSIKFGSQIFQRLRQWGRKGSPYICASLTYAERCKVSRSLESAVVANPRGTREAGSTASPKSLMVPRDGVRSSQDIRRQAGHRSAP